MFRNNCPYPIVWWISDAVHKRIIKVAPDFESWTTTLEFAISTDELLASLHDVIEALFSHVLAPSEIPFFKKLGQIDQLGSIQCSELETALKDLGDRGLNLEPKLQANINFIRGLDTLPPNNYPEKALQYLNASLEYWQQIEDFERCGLLLNQIGELNIIDRVLDDDYGIYYETKKGYRFPHYCVQPVEEEEVQEIPELENTLEQLDNLVSKAQDIINKYKK
jgi:hypothetical protein